MPIPIGLCDIRSIPWSLATYCAAALRILAYEDNKVKAKIVGQGGLPALLQLCDAAELQSDEIGIVQSEGFFLMCFIVT